MKCRGLHEVLVVEEINALGAVVTCLRCSDTYQARAGTLAERYHHSHHISPEGPSGDMDFFILASLVQ